MAQNGPKTALRSHFGSSHSGSRDRGTAADARFGIPSISSNDGPSCARGRSRLTSKALHTLQVRARAFWWYVRVVSPRGGAARVRRHSCCSWPHIVKLLHVGNTCMAWL
eukprot:2404334-Pyramimonas_sp.AAC.1